MRRSRTATAAALASIVLAAACAGAPPRVRDTAVIPTGDGNLLRYTATGVTVTDQQGREVARFANPTNKAPRGAALAMSSQLAVVAFDDQLAITELSGTNEPTWTAMGSPFATRSVTLDGDRCALVDAAGNARVVQLPSGGQLWQGRAGVGLDEVMLVIATGPAEHVAVGRSGGDIKAQRMDYRRGDGLVAAETTIRDMNVLGCAGHAGGALFVAGGQERRFDDDNWRLPNMRLLKQACSNAITDKREQRNVSFIGHCFSALFALAHFMSGEMRELRFQLLASFNNGKT